MSVQDFTRERARLVALATRMLGSWAQAEEVVQEAWLKLDATAAVRDPAAWLTTVTTRLCLDRLKRASTQREDYVGPWLPEPRLGQEPPAEPMLNLTVSLAVLHLLERLTPTQRAAWLLREVFDEDYVDIAAILETSTANVRQLVRRARRQLEELPRFQVARTEHEALLSVLTGAIAGGRLEELAAHLHADAVGYSDGGGKVKAAGVPIRGGAKLAQALVGLMRLLPPGATFEAAWVSGRAGMVTRVNGVLYGVYAFELVDGRIARVHGVLNPDKLAASAP